MYGFSDGLGGARGPEFLTPLGRPGFRFGKILSPETESFKMTYFNFFQ